MNTMKHTRTLAKICTVIPFVIYGLLGFNALCYVASNVIGYLSLSEFFLFLTMVLGWIPSLASAVAGVVFSLLSLKERHGNLFLICSCVNVAVGVAWGGAYHTRGRIFV